MTGYLAERGWDRNFLTTTMTMVIGNIVIYIFGLLWLSKLLGIELAIKFGLIPFIAGDIFKILLAAILLPLCWRMLDRRSL